MNTRPKRGAVPRTAIVLLGLVASGVCHAGPPSTNEKVNKIRERAEQAVQAGHLEEAIVHWRTAWASLPNSYPTACNIGRTSLRINHYREAAEWLTRCISLRPEPTTEKEFENRKQIVLELMTARQQVSAVTVNVLEANARLVIDKDPIRIAPILEDLFLDPGEHHFQVFKELRTAFTTLSTKPGKEYTVALVLPPSLPAADVIFPPYVPPPPPPEPDTFRWWPVAVGGGLVATAALSGLVLTGFSGNSSDMGSELLVEIQGDGKSCTQAPIDPRCASYDRYEDRSSAYSTAAIVSFVAAGAITAGVIGYAIYENRRVSVSATPTSVAMRYQW